MYPVDGFVFINDDKLNQAQGPFKILEILRLYEGSEVYYDLEGLNVFYKHYELRPAGKEEDLHDKMTNHLEIEP